MYRHVPANLRGPVTRDRDWWKSPAPAGEDAFVLRPSPDAAPGTPGVRYDLVARVRREIAEGTYDAPEKWDAALGRMLARLDRT